MNNQKENKNRGTSHLNLWMNRSFNDFFSKYSFMEDFFVQQGFPLIDKTLDLRKAVEGQVLHFEENGDTPGGFLKKTEDYFIQMLDFLGESHKNIQSITLLPGTDKAGNVEGFDSLTFFPGDIVSIVGPTGSGKSRLLGDIEWVARGDTPTKRRVLINDKEPDESWRMNPSEKLVAQLSQNMNFVMDLTVHEFLDMHAESRMVSDRDDIIDRIIEKANLLCGEAFSRNTAVTALSGGQSRALMIADTALLSVSPVILIDEIENAGIDRKKALGVLLSEGKIVLMATHDPLLALMADKRLVIQNGGIHKVLETSVKEKALVVLLEAEDKKIQNLRNDLRLGNHLSGEEYES